MINIVDESARLSHDQIKWLFANNCATSKNGRVTVDWKKAKKAGFRSRDVNSSNNKGTDSSSSSKTDNKSTKTVKPIDSVNSTKAGSDERYDAVDNLDSVKKANKLRDKISELDDAISDNDTLYNAMEKIIYRNKEPKILGIIDSVLDPHGKKPDYKLYDKSSLTDKDLEDMDKYNKDLENAIDWMEKFIKDNKKPKRAFIP